MLLLDHVRSIWVPSTTTLSAALFIGATAGVVTALFALGVAREIELENHKHLNNQVLNNDVRATSTIYFAVVSGAASLGTLLRWTISWGIS